jgi:hypothetical protein
MFGEIPHCTEAYGLFSPCMNHGPREDGEKEKMLQAIIPDFLVCWNGERELVELKFIGQTIKHFGPKVKDGARCNGVTMRAGEIQGEYVIKARNADMKYNNWDPSRGPGPVGKKLAEFGPIKALAVGPRGEMSADMHRLIAKTAKAAAQRKWRNTGTRTVVEAAGLYKFMITRSLGIAAVRANAVMITDRLGLLIGDASAAHATRQNAMENNKTAQEAYETYYARGQGGQGEGRPCR